MLDRARAAAAMNSRDFEAAIAVADEALAATLKPGITVAAFLERALGGEPLEGLSSASLPELYDPLALRWEALRRAGRKPEAGQLRELCVRYWPERIAVWANAGYQALEEGDAGAAEGYFERAHALDPASWAVLTGRAVVREMNKDWAGALELRREVAEREAAWAKDDPASLHRVLRVGANLGRLGRWMEASPLFRGALARGAYEKVPPERVTLLSVFSRELYAPALVARMCAAHPPSEAKPELQAALLDAKVLEAIARSIESGISEPFERMLALGMCAWQAGDVALAYERFDEADALREDDMAASYLLFASAIELGADELDSIRTFTLQLAEATLANAESDELARFYALLARARTGDTAQAFPESLTLNGVEHALLRQLHAWTALRERNVAAGAPPGAPGHQIARARLSAVRPQPAPPATS